ncbi:uncharacterized protein LOC110421819 isoform X2 [Herrania umbratica]|uniref:Uncharacterized protein LOC110421819 isoform X2 n=1 Tax=Herrania umbratica TaxID=108875 RepID=A0A6J1AVH2_9ROSI|nr:uncharacterized protein LOC110421819 isoform X2 [Herrania umbratica]
MEQVSEKQQSESQKNEELKKEADRAAVLRERSENLFKYAMTNEWQKVATAYEKEPESRKAKITEAEDTVLHLAVSAGKLEFVRKLVEILGANVSNVLKAKNERGNTPLHIAAALGNAHMCRCMASKDSSLIAENNKKNETPFFLAAKYGHKDAFFCLYFCYPEGKRGDICSRDAKGNTSLHAAIGGEHFDLAFQIICTYPELANAFNVNGLSPLHVLATKTNAFKSGSRLGLFDSILYSCIVVDRMKEKEYDSNDYQKKFKENDRDRFPPTYETCARFFRMFLDVVCFGMPSFVEICSSTSTSSLLSCINHKKEKKGNSNTDEENPQGTSKVTDQGTSPKAKAEHRADYVPENYTTFIQFFKFVMKFVMVVLGLGFQRIKKITTKKQRHTWASQVMDKLIENASTYKYSGSGGQTGTGIGGMTEEFPYNPSLMSASSQDTNTGNDSKVEILDKQGERHNETGSSKKEGKDALVEKFLGEYRITGTVDSKTSKHAVEMKFEKKVAVEPTKQKRPILIAASNGITEMVERILDKFPVAILDVDAENKNIMLLAVENRQTHTFQFLVETKKDLHESVFRKWDSQGNNALHLAATYGNYRPWLIPGSALQMQWEIKWYKFVKKSLAKHLLGHYNNKGQTPKQIFTETHKTLVKDGSEWLTKTSESCSLIAALIATVAFATAANIPGGVSHGKPVLRDEPAFDVFAISSLVALCFSVTALVFFLAILTSRFEEKDFYSKLPRKLIWGLTSLFTSIAAMLVSFCAGHFFELRDELKFAALPIYTATCLPISLFALAQLSLYFDLLWAICQKVPQRSYRESAS